MASLLAHLASRFTTQQEVIATEALGFILKQSPAAREGLSFVLATCAGSDDRVGSVATQVVEQTIQPAGAAGTGRPDLVAYDKADRMLAIIEGKFWAGLTDAQPIQYLEQLKAKGGKALVFVAPNERLDSLSLHIGSRIESATGNRPVWTVVSGYRVARLDGQRNIAITSWTRLLEALEHSCHGPENEGTRSDLGQLRELVMQFEAEGYHPLSGEELSDLATPRQIATLVGLYEKAVEQAKQADLLNTEGLRPTHYRLASGRYVRFAEAIAWLGVDFELWAQHHVSPLWLWFSKDDWGAADAVRALESWEREPVPRLFRGLQHGGAAIPLPVLPGADEDAAIKGILTRLKEVRDGLHAAGLAPLNRSAESNNASFDFTR